MKHRLPLTLAAMGGLLLGSQTAHAIAFQDYDVIDVILRGAGDSYNGTFSITSPDTDGPDGSVGDIRGFVPSLYTVTSATASFELYSDDHDKEQVDINLGSWDLLTTPGSQINGTVVFSNLLSLAMIADLQSDGSISYRLRLENSPNEHDEDVRINWGKLVVNASPRSVPDGGATLGLFGLGLLGLATLKRKFVAQR